MKNEGGTKNERGDFTYQELRVKLQEFLGIESLEWQKIMTVKSQSSIVNIDRETMLLSIEFTDGLRFVLLPELEPEVALPDWELFMPDGIVLQAGQSWSLIDAG